MPRSTVAGRVAIEIEAQTRAFEQGMRTAQGRLRRFERQIEKTRRSTGGLTRSLGRVNSALASLRAAPLIGGAVAGLGIGAAFGGAANIARTAGEIESIQVRLENLVGSVEQANRVWRELQGYAATTPFLLRDIVNVYADLEAFNFQPTIEDIQKLGDLTAFFGSSIDKLGRAIKSALAGEFEPLRRFGIQFSKQGETLIDINNKAAGAIANNARAILDYINTVASAGNVQGSTAKQTNTLQGAISQVGDASDIAAFNIGEGGLTGSLTEFNLAIADSLNSGERWQRQLGSILGTVVDLGTAFVQAFFPAREAVEGLDDAHHQMLLEIRDVRYEAAGLREQLAQAPPAALKGIEEALAKQEELLKSLVKEAEEYRSRLLLIRDTEIPDPPQEEAIGGPVQFPGARTDFDETGGGIAGSAQRSVEAARRRLTIDPARLPDFSGSPIDQDTAAQEAAGTASAASQAASEEWIREFNRRREEEIRQAEEAANRTTELQQEAARKSGDAFERAFERFAEGGDSAKSIITDLVKELILAQVQAKLLGTSFGQTEFGGSLIAGLGGIFGRQHGGPVSAGRGYVVGDGGEPELFVPNQSGRILNGRQLAAAGGSGETINITINGVEDATIVRAAAAQGAREGRAQVERDRTRPGRFGR